MPAASDSSPLILFARIGTFILLREVFTEIWIAPAVHREVVIEGAGRPGSDEVRAAPWIVDQPFRPPFLPAALTADLDAGEAQTITLAWQVQADLPVLLDDAAARRVGLNLGLRVFGCAGILVEAKRLGLISAVRGPLDRLVGSGHYLSRVAYQEALGAAGEAEGGPLPAP